MRDALLGRERADPGPGRRRRPPGRSPGRSAESSASTTRFGTATVTVEGRTVDVARARAESYPYPGALPEVQPAGIDADLSRARLQRQRDGRGAERPEELIDPRGGGGPATRGCCASCTSARSPMTPTRAAGSPLRRAAGPRARGRNARSNPRGRPERRVGGPDRGRAPQAGGGAEPGRGFELLDRWGLIPMAPAAPRLIEAIVELAQREPWRDEVRDRDGAILAAAAGDVERPSAVAALRPRSPRPLAAAQGLSEAELPSRAPWARTARRLRRRGSPPAPPNLGAGPRRRRHRTGRRSAGDSTRPFGPCSTARRRAAKINSETALQARSPNCPLMEWRRQGGVRWLHAGLPRALAAFSTRLGGRSAGPFESLSLGLRTGDERAAVLTNRARLAAAIDPLIRTGCCSAARCTRPKSSCASRRARPNPMWAGNPRRRQTGRRPPTPRLTPLVQVADCRWRWLESVASRCCTAAGAGSRRGSSPVASRRSAPPRRRSARGSAAAAARSTSRSSSRFADLGDGIATGRMLDLEAVATRLLERAGRGRDRGGRAVHELQAGAVLHRRDRGRAGHQGNGFIWIADAKARFVTSTRPRCAPTSSGSRALRPGSRSWRRRCTSCRRDGRLAEAGVELVGENRLQDLEASGRATPTHSPGRGSSAASRALGEADPAAGSLDPFGRHRLGARAARPPRRPRVEVLVESNLAGEQAKGGVAPAELGGSSRPAARWIGPTDHAAPSPRIPRPRGRTSRGSRSSRVRTGSRGSRWARARTGRSRRRRRDDHPARRQPLSLAAGQLGA